MHLYEMMSCCTDVDLVFTDGKASGSKAHLSMVSSVFCGAIEADKDSSTENSRENSNTNMDNSNSNIDNSNSSSSSTSRLQIPVAGVSIGEWMQVARFCYPVSPPAEVQGWQEAELLLRVGSQLDMPLLMHAADHFITAQVQQLDGNDSSPRYILRWLKLADKYALSKSLAAIAAHAASVPSFNLNPGGPDQLRFWCRDEANLQDLSPAALRQLVMALAPPRYRYLASPPGMYGPPGTNLARPVGPPPLAMPAGPPPTWPDQ